jgi:hypothetical protein
MVRAILVVILLASCLLLREATAQSTFPSTIRDRSPTFTPSDFSNSTIRSRSPVIATPSRLWLDWAYPDRYRLDGTRWAHFYPELSSYYWSVVRGGSGPFSGLYSSRHLYEFSAGCVPWSGDCLAPAIEWGIKPTVWGELNPYGSVYSAF